MIVFLFIFAIVGMLTCLRPATLVLLIIARHLIVLARRALAFLPRPYRKADAPHDALTLRADEEITYARMAAGCKRTAPEPSCSMRRQL